MIEALEDRLRQPLPGLDAQLEMAPATRTRKTMTPVRDSSFKSGAVLILLYPSEEIWHTVLMLRPQYDGTHAGQVSFPGGKIEPHDNSLADTALREANEEVGVPIEEVKVIGRLTDLYIPVSKFNVSPFVGYMSERPEFVPDEKEVDEIIEVSLDYLFQDQIVVQTRVPIQQRNLTIQTPAFEVHGNTVWGATAMIISELKAVMSDLNSL